MTFGLFLLLGIVAPLVIPVALAWRGWLTWVGAVAGVVAMLLLMYWVNSDIEHSDSSTAALGYLVLPPLLYLVGAAIFVVDRAAVLGWRFTHRSGDASM